ncbi:MAG: M48 family metallopeptidase [Synechococcus sp. SB0668_bin_15]|nr:M48 family metallopeptidase [Synechococcus sp. SB0668_bin_15]MXZ82995.1 M48 family metallopeptidase [Synechococcus sp. SB0666_bin_14]MYA91098.1 M48 family metallopeptidase [Synechococcus sp. SB0663_bin_10]MYC50449.1 M48 family metallopeptidase [Synechococcus sp. SB0662_bin_14]MYJ59777.1 M48 family metallopeptidase [Synechococcus sp. SB0672_bin_6]MYK92277.1 M48 family metallopeptidase [Synechococcus sp. SB0669_bin_8]
MVGLRFVLRRACWLLMAALVAGCATSPTGRQQFMLVSPDAAISMAQAAYLDTVRQFARGGKLMNDPLLAERMARITGRLVAVAVQEYPHTARWEWSVALVDDADVLNAWAMAGGRMAIFRGLVEKLDLSDDEIAHIMGHEIAHAVANHHAERMSMVLAQNLAVSVVKQNTEQASQAAPIANTVATVALTLPNSRSGEEEADKLGMRMATKAGYDPQAAVTLWQKMARHGGARPPEFLSTHPDPASRVTALSALVDHVQHLRPTVPPAPHRVRIYGAK